MLIDAPDSPTNADFHRPVLADCTVPLRRAGLDAATAQAVTWLADQGLFGTHRVVSPGAGI